MKNEEKLESFFVLRSHLELQRLSGRPAGRFCPLDRLPPPAVADAPALDAAAERVHDCLRNRGASFVTDLARDTELPPSTVRAALWTLLRRRLVTNDHFDVIRKGEEAAREPGDNGTRRPQERIRVSSMLRRRGVQRPEGRWSLLPWSTLPSPETQAVLMASRLLHRYGVAARELALLDPWMPPWRVLYEVLSRMELAGEVRRGYFAEGLSGAQFALLPPENATGNFTKIVQRVPVKILLDPKNPLTSRLRPGLSVTATVDTHDRPQQAVNQALR